MMKRISKRRKMMHPFIEQADSDEDGLNSPEEHDNMQKKTTIIIITT